MLIGITRRRTGLLLRLATLPVCVIGLRLVAAPAVGAVSPAAHTANRAMLRVLSDVARQDLQLLQHNEAGKINAYVVALDYIDVSHCPRNFRKLWATFTATCQKVDVAAQLAHRSPCQALGLSRLQHFSSLVGSHSGIDSPRWPTAVIWRLGMACTRPLPSVSSGISKKAEGNLAAARDTRQFALIPLCESALEACSADSRLTRLRALAVIYALNCMEQQFTAAFRSANAAAHLGDAAAMVSLGSLFNSGLGTRKDYSKAMKWWRKGGAAGSGLAMYDIGTLYGSGHGIPQNPTKGMIWFLMAAVAGSGHAMLAIGEFYDLAQGVPQHYAKAMRWYRKAAAAGSGGAMTLIGMLYLEGHGVPQDYAKAMKWYRKGAAAGSGSAMHNIGVLYEKGQGVPQNYVQAMKWWRKAAAAGSGHAMGDLGWLYYRGHGVTQSYAMAMRWWRRGAAARNGLAMLGIGLLYDKGYGVPQDYAKALYWLRKAEVSGMPPDLVATVKKRIAKIKQAEAAQNGGQ